jgi:hypothetical protein
VNIIVNLSRSECSGFENNSSKYDSNEKDKSSVNDKLMSPSEAQLNMLDLEEPSPLTYINDSSRPFPELVVIGHHWSPKRSDEHP